jgi:hypothetical protein
MRHASNGIEDTVNDQRRSIGERLSFQSAAQRRVAITEKKLVKASTGAPVGFSFEKRITPDHALGSARR